MKRLYFILLAVVMIACNQHDKKLIADAENMLQNNPDSALLLLNKVKNLGRMGDADVAKYWLITAQAHALTGLALSEDSAITFALDFYRQQQPVDSAALRKAQTFASSYYWWTEQPEKAKKLMKASLEESKKSGDKQEQLLVLHGMAELAILENDMDDAEFYVEELLKQDGGDKNHADLLNSLALMYYYHGNKQACLATFKRAVANVATASDSTYVWKTVMRNYADILIVTGQTEQGIVMQERILKHYKEAGMENENIGPLFSLSYAWLFKGDRARARHYLSLAEACPPNDSDNYFDATQYSILAHKMVLDYAETGRYNVVDMAHYANRMQGKNLRRDAIASAKERAIRQLREHELWLMVSRQQQFIVFILLTVGLTSVIIGLGVYLKRRRRLLAEKEEEMDALRRLLADSLQTNAKDDRFVKKIMLQQLGVIRHAAANPTAANQQLLQRMTAIANREVRVDTLLNWDDLYKTIDSVYDGFYTRMHSRYSQKLNERDQQLCCLLKANFSTKEISFVTQQSVRTVYQRKTQVRQKLALEEKENIADALS